jgi:hypothetical protein
MSNVKIIMVIILTNLFIVSCNDNDNIEPLPANLGIYELQSLKSNIAMDLDYDGFDSTDFKQELQLWWFSIPQRQTYDHVKLLESNINGKYWVRTLGIPRDDHDDNDPDPSFRFKPDARTHYLYIENGQIVSFEEQKPSFDPFDPDDILGKARPYLLSFDTETKITMEMTQYFYDYRINEWTQVSLVAKFDKIADNL